MALMVAGLIKPGMFKMSRRNIAIIFGLFGFLIPILVNQYFAPKNSETGKMIERTQDAADSTTEKMRENSDAANTPADSNSATNNVR